MRKILYFMIALTVLSLASCKDTEGSIGDPIISNGKTVTAISLQAMIMSIICLSSSMSSTGYAGSRSGWYPSDSCRHRPDKVRSRWRESP